jgi:hypothetical protein
LEFPFGTNNDSAAASEGTMRPKKHEITGAGDLSEAWLDQIINLKHEQVQLAAMIDWDFIGGEMSIATRGGPPSPLAL